LLDQLIADERRKWLVWLAALASYYGEPVAGGAWGKDIELDCVRNGVLPSIALFWPKAA